MVTKANNNVVRDIDKLNDSEILAVSEYISQLLSKPLPISTENQFNDDLIAALAERRENQRARQVLEWEYVRRKNIPRAA